MSTADAFVGRYGAVYELSPWVAEEAAAIVGPGDPPDVIASVMAECVDNATRERRLALIRAHPDLAGKARAAGALTAESTKEQASAGLDNCSAEEYTKFQELNRAYGEKFGFPFVMAVRDRTRAEILAAFETRLENDVESEFETALAEIHEIARLRISAMDTDR